MRGETKKPQRAYRTNGKSGARTSKGAAAGKAVSRRNKKPSASKAVTQAKRFQVERSANPGKKGSKGRGNKSGASEKNKKNEKRPPIYSRISPKVAILIILFGVFIAFSIGPVTRNIEATSKLRDKEKELKEEAKTTEALEAEVEEARSLEHIEREAREQHMAAPGETVYIITSERNEEDPDVKVKSPQSMDEAWERVRWYLECSH